MAFYTLFMATNVGAWGGVKIPAKAEAFFEDEADTHVWDQDARGIFKLNETHIKLLRQLNFSWNGVESGAPFLDPEAPLTKRPLKQIGSEFGVKSKPEQARLYVELVWALNDYFRAVNIEPGDYSVDKDTYAQIQQAMTGYHGLNDVSDIGLTEDGKIRLEQANITILKQGLWQWDESGAEEGGWPGAAMDCKRPYGYMSYWQIEMADTLGLTMQKTEEGYFRTTPEQDDYLQSVHFKQLSAVIAIVKHGKVEL